MATPPRYWLELPNGSRQLIDPRQFDLQDVARAARRLGGRLIAERSLSSSPSASKRQAGPSNSKAGYEPPIAALSPLFRSRLNRIHDVIIHFDLDVSPRPTARVLGGYYRKRRLVRIYAVDRETGRRPLAELFDTFLHEMAHHLEYTEPDSFRAPACERVPGLMHSPLFWRIYAELRDRWTAL